jgi:hypothetical protein
MKFFPRGTRPPHFRVEVGVGGLAKSNRINDLRAKNYHETYPRDTREMPQTSTRDTPQSQGYLRLGFAFASHFAISTRIDRPQKS